MVFTTQKQTFYGIQMDDWTYTWAGLDYNNYLMSEMINENLNYTATTDNDAIRYLMPFSPASSYVIDGLVEGFFCVYNADTGTASTFNSYTISLKKTKDVPSAEETLGTMVNAVADTVAVSSYAYYPIYFWVDEKEIDAEDELLLLYMTMDFTNGDLEWSHANVTDPYDLTVKIPFP